MTPKLFQPTLNELLALRGFTIQTAPGVGTKHIMKDGMIVFTGDTKEVWKWIKKGSV